MNYTSFEEKLHRESEKEVNTDAEAVKSVHHCLMLASIIFML